MYVIILCQDKMGIAEQIIHIRIKNENYCSKKKKKTRDKKQNYGQGECTKVYAILSCTAIGVKKICF